MTISSTRPRSIQDFSNSPTLPFSSPYLFGADARLLAKEGWLIPVPNQDPNTLLFIRDLWLTLPCGRVLLPYTFRDHPEGLFKALQPESGFHFIDSPRNGFGIGCLAEGKTTARQIIDQIEALKTADVMQGSTALEGGNCFFTKNRRNEPVAMIGMNSLILSLLALEEQKIFSEEILKHHQAKEPSDWAYRMARNEGLYRPREQFDQRLAEISKTNEEEKLSLEDSIKLLALRKKIMDEKLQKCGSNLTYRQNLKAPVLDSEKQELHQKALEFETKLGITRKRIAEDLRLPLDSIAFLSQHEFHIDFELLPIDSTILIHDERSFSDRLKTQKNTKEYWSAAQRRMRDLSQNMEELRRIGCDPIRIVGLYKATGQPTLNFMNGVFREGTLYTNGAPVRFNDLEQIFAEDLQRQTPSVGRVVFLEGLSDLLQHNGGGLHCLTQEFSRNSDIDF